ncbi:hypothetical protein IV203_030122 [Nitzschia inconspicua]|uniref:Uncharacterized protein n=1 Tax=Nitzschia inconspicua TaxID=303405 RepID=A0A9K3Q1L0_9STRA|nr:hypothetical protein IV203_030122 [Nitzschia inconspicua]
MVVPNETYGGNFGMRTTSNVSALNSMNAKALEAELISRATQTAIVAARSILLSGGSEEVALKTAKAAAESVLNPQASDSDTISGRSTLGSAFGGRKRKAKRQAEVVASMALMSASSGIRPAGSSMSISEWDNGPSNHPYGRNIITFRQDEPSVLSGSISTRPPRVPTPKSHTSNPSASGGPLSKMTSSSSTGHNAMQFGTSVGGSPRNTSKIRDTSGMFFPSPKTSPSPGTCTANESSQEQDAAKMSKDNTKDDNNNNATSSFLDKILNIKPTSPKSSEKSNTSAPKVANKLFELESDSVSQNDTMDSDRQSSMESSLGDEDSAADTATVESARNNNQSRRDRKEIENSWKYNLDPLIVKVTKTLNIFSCGPLGPFSGGQVGDDLEELEAIRSTSESPARRGRHRSSAALESRDDTFDDNTTSYTCDDSNTEMTGIHARKGNEDRGEYRDPDFGLIESRSSESSNELLRELDMSDASEGAIQVRSSIRETMEKIVSKSKKGHRRGGSRNDYRNTGRNKDVDRKWLSYELREKKGVEPETSALSSKKKSKKATTSSNSGGRTPTPTKKSGGGGSSNKSVGNKSVGKKQSFFFKKSKGG